MLQLAAQRGKLQQVIKWLQKDGHVEALAENGFGLLHGAAGGGQLRVAEEMLQDLVLGRGGRLPLEPPDRTHSVPASAIRHRTGRG